jgi:5-methylcytosine-specific restriction endonuclease McrA
MTYSNPLAQKDYQHRWYRDVVVGRRDEWFKRNGPCKHCGSWENLELDHVDPSQKESHSVWSWTDIRRDLELKKCQPLCRNCHQKKTNEENKRADVWDVFRKHGPEGTEWCNGHKAFISRGLFSPKYVRWNGVHEYCRECRNKGNKIGKSL